ncbi:hypothetical protein BGZ63DRAFT_417078 [Mariannaea sp. PMI_226]|nr:hypothetical protein BGZ63DRAFT_417078 [Mariannaea sp. PMI_226]
MKSENRTIFDGHSYVTGDASGTVLPAYLELSFWGGVNPKTGEVIDRFHPLSGCLLKDTILAIPGGRGSCGGSVIMMELILNGLGPKALIFERPEEIITLGVMVAEEFFGKTVPVLSLKPKDFREVLGWKGKTAHLWKGQISDRPFEVDAADAAIANSGGDRDTFRVQLSDLDREILSGDHGRAANISMKVIIRLAEMMEATELIDVSQAHADGAWYGPGSVAFGTRLRDWGGKFRVPTTINAINVDQKRWKALGVDMEYGTACDELAEAFVDMGATRSFTCAPYLLETAPKLGDRIAWGESNAVIYANSVLGARTLKNPNMLEVLIALTGRAPKSGHIVQPPEDMDDSFWHILGYSLGALANTRTPVITGLEHLKPSNDDFKAFSAAFATASSAPMFHMVNLTPEAPTLEAACPEALVPEAIDFHWRELEACWDEFNQGSSLRQEMKKLAELCRGRTKSKDVSVVITCGRAQYGLAKQAGHVEILDRFGVQFLTDTCWCSIEDPVIPKSARVIMTNSGKYIHYGPGLTGRQFCFGSLNMCVEAACSGQSTGKPPAWLGVQPELRNESLATLHWEMLRI